MLRNAGSTSSRLLVGAQARVLLGSFTPIVSGVASMSDATIDGATLFAGTAFLGLPHATAPRKGVDADAIVDSASFPARRCQAPPRHGHARMRACLVPSVHTHTHLRRRCPCV